MRVYCFGVNVTGRLRGAKRAESGARSAWRANVGASANVIAPRGALLARGGTSGYERSQGVVDGRPAIAWGSSPASRCGAPGGIASRSSARRQVIVQPTSSDYRTSINLGTVSEYRTLFSVLSSGRPELRCHVDAAFSGSLERTAHETSDYAPRAPRMKRLRRMAGLDGCNPTAGNNLGETLR
jgi:hypothetical protein